MFIFVCLYMYRYIYIHICTYIYVHLYVYICIYTHIHIYAVWHMHTLSLSPSHMHTHTHTHAHTHTHTLSLSLSLSHTHKCIWMHDYYRPTTHQQQQQTYKTMVKTTHHLFLWDQAQSSSPHMPVVSRAFHQCFKRHMSCVLLRVLRAWCWDYVTFVFCDACCVSRSSSLCYCVWQRTTRHCLTL